MNFDRINTLNSWRGRGLDFFVGAGAVLGLAPFHLWPVAILAFGYLFLRLDGALLMPKRSRAGFARGFWFALGYFVFGLYWIGSAFIVRGASFVWIMPFAILLLCAGLALIWGTAGAIVAKFAPRFGSWSWLWAALVLMGAESFRGHAFSGFPWNLPGYIFEAGKPISQSAHWIGIYGLTALVWLLSASLGRGLADKKYFPFGLFFALFVGLFWVGQNRLSKANIAYVSGVKLRLVQSNIPQKDKFDPDKYIETANAFLSLSAGPGLEAITHVIWPEGALPGLMFQDRNLLNAVGQALKKPDGSAPVFIAQSLRAVNDGNTTDYYNSAAAVTFSNTNAPEISEFYDKQKLVPFGEFIPMHEWLEKLGLKSLSTALESMTPGTGDVNPTLPGLPPVSIQICYEILFPGATPKTLDSSGTEPEWILNLSNDSWYGDSIGPKQQANQAQYRAIETGLPVIRATSGGITASIDPYGRKIANLPLSANQTFDVFLPKPIKN